MNGRRRIAADSSSVGEKTLMEPPAVTDNNNYEAFEAEPATEDDSAAVDDGAENSADSASQSAAVGNITSVNASTAAPASKVNYNLRLRGCPKGEFGHMHGYNHAGSGYGSTSVSERDRQYWAPGNKRDPVAFHAKLMSLKMLQREFGDSISYPQEFAEALGLSSSRDACVATEFPDGVEEVKEEDTQMWYVERIIAHRKENSGTKYLVKWRGWPNSCNSWEPAETVFAPEQISAYYKKYGAKPPNSLVTVCFDQSGKIKKYDKIKASEVIEQKTRKR